MMLICKQCTSAAALKQCRPSIINGLTGRRPSDMPYSYQKCLQTRFVSVVCFDSTYSCEKLFSVLKNVTLRTRTYLTHGHLEGCMGVHGNRNKTKLNLILIGY
jgi:hypothetical protein